MSLAKAIYARLSTESTITNLVEGRVYPSEAPQEEKHYPRIVFEIEDAGQDPSPSAQGPSSLVLGSVSIAAIALNITDARALAEAIRDAIDGREDDVWGEVSVQSRWAEGYAEEPIPLDMGQDRIEYVAEREFSIWFNR